MLQAWPVQGARESYAAAAVGTRSALSWGQALPFFVSGLLPSLSPKEPTLLKFLIMISLYKSLKR